MRNKAAGLLAVTTMVLGGCGATHGPSARGSSGDSPGGPPGGSHGLDEALGVHGNWSIEVSNPDGTRDAYVEFENAFTGAWAIARALTGGDTAGEVQYFRIEADSAPAGSGPCTSVDQPGRCFLSEFTGSLSVEAIGPTPGDPQPSNDAVSLVLAGSFTADQDGEIGSVEAWLAYLDGTVPQPFSDRVLDAPVAVAAGQIVQIEVTYTFGSA